MKMHSEQKGSPQVSRVNGTLTRKDTAMDTKLLAVAAVVLGSVTALAAAQDGTVTGAAGGAVPDAIVDPQTHVVVQVVE